MKYTLKKFKERNLDFKEMDNQTEVLQKLLDREPNEEVLRAIMDFQEENGNFAYIDPQGAPSDARVDFYYTPTYLCTATLMKSFLQGIPKGIGAAELEDSLRRGLKASIGRKFEGHGIHGVEDAAAILQRGGSEDFVTDHPDFCPEFTEVYREKVSFPVFVYGTLLQGRSNHGLLEEASYARFETRGRLEDYALYDLGSYPGIKPWRGEKVLGEVYRVNLETLKRLDQLEGEGSLYRRRWVRIRTAQGGELDAYAYIYMHRIDPADRIPVSKQPYSSDRELVWYVTYGSNMMHQRMMCYIQGGIGPNGVEYSGCTDGRMPFATKGLILPYERYFAKASPSWEGKGVAFLDLEAKGRTMCRAYLITRDQLKEIQSQEGAGWYDRVAPLKDLPVFEGIPAVTITGDWREEEQEPSDRYLSVIEQGEEETERLIRRQSEREDREEKRRAQMRGRRQKHRMKKVDLSSLENSRWKS